MRKTLLNLSLALALQPGELPLDPPQSKHPIIHKMMTPARWCGRKCKAGGHKLAVAIDKFEPTARRIGVVTTCLSAAFFFKGLVWGIEQ